jgi:hypothetical protein
MARIRTIKPEFWQNEDIASLSEHARLLAIAILNFCDDEGFFLANPSLVRANCFPFQEDSRNIPGSLQELSAIGYVEIRDCSGKAIGRVVKFLAHQRIEKAQKSKLASMFLKKELTDNQENASSSDNSATIPGTIQEFSGNGHGLERKGKEHGTERKGEGKEGSGESPLSLSLHGKDVNFQKAWMAWIAKQSAKSGRIDQWTQQGQLKELARFSTEEAIEVVEYSTSRTNCINLITNGDHARARASPGLAPGLSRRGVGGSRTSNSDLLSKIK